MTDYCRYCGKGPFATQGGLNRHIGCSKDCQEKNRLAFKSYTSTLWKNGPDATDDHPTSPSPPADAQLVDLEHDLLAVEQNFSLDNLTEISNLPIPQLEPHVQRNRVPEEETQESRHYIEEYPSEQKAGAAWGKDQPLFMQIQREQQENGTSKWGPFMDQDEWELAAWLSKNVGQKQTDAFLKLNIVSTYSLVTMQRAVIMITTDQKSHATIL
jgi:hypothetical protein